MLVQRVRTVGLAPRGDLVTARIPPVKFTRAHFPLLHLIPFGTPAGRAGTPSLFLSSHRVGPG